MMKKLLPIALGTSLIMLLASCGNSQAKSASSSENTAAPSSTSSTASSAAASTSETTSTQLANPFVDCTDLTEAVNLAGFAISEPKGIPAGYSQTAVRAIKGEMIELIYTSGEDEIRVRAGAKQEDISGDYNTYDEKNELTVNDISVATKGNGGMVMVATWNVDSYSFSITSTAGISTDVVEEIVKTIV